MSEENKTLSEIVSIKSLSQLSGGIVSVAGWVKNRRLARRGTLLFIDLTDGTCVKGVQLVIDDKVHIDLKSLHKGMSIHAQGQFIDSEIQVSSITVLGQCDPAMYPLSGKGQSLEFLRQQVGHLKFRTSTIASIFRIRSELSFATHQFFNQQDFFHMHTPLITTSDCEGGGEMFKVSATVEGHEEFFGKPAFLTVSGQLAAETAALAMSRVYTFGPTFRAENSNTSRHLAEFWMIEPEVAFADLKQNMHLAQEYIKFCASYLLEHNRSDLELLTEFENVNEVISMDHWTATPLIERVRSIASCDTFAHLTYTEVIDLLKSAISDGVEFKESEIEWGMDLGSEHERYICEVVKKGPTIVTNYPKAIKAFYMREDPGGKTVSAMDVLVPGVGELVGGSQREERLDVLQRMIDEHGLDTKDYDWYLDTRRFGTVPHSGFGVGFERLVAYFTGIKNIKDVCMFHRTVGQCDF